MEEIKEKANYFKMPGAKGLSPHDLAHRWVSDLLTLVSKNLYIPAARSRP